METKAKTSAIANEVTELLMQKALVEYHYRLGFTTLIQYTTHTSLLNAQIDVALGQGFE